MESELLTRLGQFGVEYAVVGGHAVLCYSPAARADGTFRTLGDLDVLVASSDDNLVRISGALSSIGISLTSNALGSIFRAKLLPNLTGGYRAQLFPQIDGVDTLIALRTSQSAHSVAGVVPVIEKNLLIQSKKAAGRPKDLEDVRALEAARECTRAV